MSDFKNSKTLKASVLVSALLAATAAYYKAENACSEFSEADSDYKKAFCRGWTGRAPAPVDSSPEHF